MPPQHLESPRHRQSTCPEFAHCLVAAPTWPVLTATLGFWSAADVLLSFNLVAMPGLRQPSLISPRACHFLIHSTFFYSCARPIAHRSCAKRRFPCNLAVFFSGHEHTCANLIGWLARFVTFSLMFLHFSFFIQPRLSIFVRFLPQLTFVPTLCFHFERYVSQCHLVSLNNPFDSFDLRAP